MLLRVSYPLCHSSPQRLLQCPYRVEVRRFLYQCTPDAKNVKARQRGRPSRARRQAPRVKEHADTLAMGEHMCFGRQWGSSATYCTPRQHRWCLEWNFRARCGANLTSSARQEYIEHLNAVPMLWLRRRRRCAYSGSMVDDELIVSAS